MIYSKSLDQDGTSRFKRGSPGGTRSPEMKTTVMSDSGSMVATLPLVVGAREGVIRVQLVMVDSGGGLVVVKLVF